jgi:hypothetical protein
MKIKDRVELISKMADITYKKMVVLLATVGGSGSYAIRQDGFFKIMLFTVTGIFSLGLVINYFELNKKKKDLEEIEHG